MTSRALLYLETPATQYTLQLRSPSPPSLSFRKLQSAQLQLSRPRQCITRVTYASNAAGENGVSSCKGKSWSGSPSSSPSLVVIGGGAAGIFGAICAKEACSDLDVIVLERVQPLSKVKVSGGGRCNVTTGLHVDPQPLAKQYPRGNRELRGAFFHTFGPRETASWFEERGVALKTEPDGRMFPVSNTSESVIRCLLNEAQHLGVTVRTGYPVSTVVRLPGGMFRVNRGVARSGTNGAVEKPPLDADYVLVASGSSPQGYVIAEALGHSIIDPRPSLFTFRVADDPHLTALAGVSLPHVEASLEVPGITKRDPHLSQAGPLLVTHWGLSGPVVLRLSAWAARHLHQSAYKGVLRVDLLPQHNEEGLLQMLLRHKETALKRKVANGAPLQLELPRRFWLYLLQRLGLDPETTWGHLPNKVVRQLASILKHLPILVSGKGEFKDEFVTAGGVALKELDLRSMESRICPRLFFAGEVVDIDGVTGGFNFQNAWTGGYIAGTAIAAHANSLKPVVDSNFSLPS